MEISKEVKKEAVNAMFSALKKIKKAQVNDLIKFREEGDNLKIEIGIRIVTSIPKNEIEQITEVEEV